MNINYVPAHAGNYIPGRRGHTPDRIVIHVADGTFDGTLDWFSRPECSVSAHFTVGTDGRIGQSVRVEDTAYHAGDWAMNQRSIGIEHEGMPARGPWVPSPAQLAASADLVAQLCRRFGIPADRTHIIAHSEVNPSRAARHNCPGPTWPWAAYITRVQQLLAPAPAHVADPEDKRIIRLFDPQTNLQIGTASLIVGSDKAYIIPPGRKL